MSASEPAVRLNLADRVLVSLGSLVLLVHTGLAIWALTRELSSVLIILPYFTFALILGSFRSSNATAASVIRVVLTAHLLASTTILLTRLLR